MTPKRRAAWVVLAALAVGALAVAAIDVGGAATDEERIQALSESFACPECDGQSVAESNAAVAATIRQFIRAEVIDGSADREIRDELVRAYGGDVLLTPPSDGISALVWILPVVVGVAGTAGLVVVVSRHRLRSAAASAADEALVARARADRDR